jgi:glutamate synthase domain-containing protein 3
MTVATTTSTHVRIDASGVYYRQLNEQIRAAIAAGATHVTLDNVLGQRYIGCGLRNKGVTIEINGTPGQDLAAFMDGPEIIVHGNGQDGVCNTQTSGTVVIHGSAGDVLAHGLRGGCIYIRGNAGYRCCIHMKQFAEPVPVAVIGGTLGDYAGEYMAGGALMVLGLDRAPGAPLVGRLLGTGMHNGALYLRGDVADYQMGKEISRRPLDDKDRQRLETYVGEFARYFGMNAREILAQPFTKFLATSVRPYGRMYVY